MVALSAICKLLVLTGFAPVYDACVNCTEAVEGDAFLVSFRAALFAKPVTGRGRVALYSGAQKLLQELIALDFNDPQPFTVRGGDLMQLEQILYRFIVYQIDKPLKSLSF
ncbi:MAG: DNA repair protein RecO [Phascolarctobacterium faecium]